MFKFEGLKSVSHKKGNTKEQKTQNDVIFSIREGKDKRKTIFFAFEPNFVADKLEWNNVERVLLFANGKNVFGISPANENEVGSYKLIKAMKKDGSISRYEFALSWHEHIFKESKPKTITSTDESPLQYQVITEGRKKGLFIIIPESFFNDFENIVEEK
jgi:hypothetical protein